MTSAGRNVALLALCQALFTTSNAVVITASALAGQQLAPGSGLATLPLSLQFVATMVVIAPASFVMRRIGRRAGFAIGAGCGLLGSIISSVAILAGSFWLFCLAGFVYGGFLGFAQYYRFAAAEAAGADFRPRAIAYVLAGGVVAAVAGPEIAKLTKDMLSPVLFAGCYVAVAALALTNLAVVAWIDIPASGDERSGPSRPLAVIARQPAFIVAVLGAMVSYGTMTLVMTATPLAMVACAHPFDAAALVIQWHIVGMFAPSFVTGRLIDRFGVIRIMLVGCGLLLIAVTVGVSGIEVVHFWITLTLIGLGWNFLFVGATTLLTTTYRPAEKAKVQAVNDLAVFGTVAFASLSSGAIQHFLGWTAVNLAFVVPLLLVLSALLWLQSRPETERTLPVPS